MLMTTQTADAPRRGKTHPPSKNRVWDFFQATHSCTESNWQITQCSRLENQPTPTTTASGVPYYGYRYYSPEMGRWLSRDPIGLIGGRNYYVFVHNLPIVFYDNLGLSGNGTACCTSWTARYVLNYGPDNWVPYGDDGGTYNQPLAQCMYDEVLQRNNVFANAVSTAIANGATGLGSLLAAAIGQGSLATYLTEAGIFLTIGQLLNLAVDTVGAYDHCKEEKCMATVAKIPKPWNEWPWFICEKCPDGSEEVDLDDNGEGWRSPE